MTISGRGAPEMHRMIQAVTLGACLMALIGTGGCGDDGEGGKGVSANRDEVLRGRYLVTAAADCVGCHSPGKDPNDPMWLAGYTSDTSGQPFVVQGYKVYPANLTPDAETGLGQWTPDQMFNALRTGKDDEGHYLCPPMPWPVFRNMTDEDLFSIGAYLKSIKPVHHQVPISEGP